MDNQAKAWLKAYRRGDVEALGQLVEHYRRPLYGFILKMTEGHGDADEVFQETWMRAVRSIDRFKKGEFLSWLFRIARNLVIDRARKQRPEISLQQEIHTDGISLEEQLPATGHGPADDVSNSELSCRIARAVEQLAPEQKEVFIMRTQSQLAFKEIARIQGVSINTALARMQYALNHLRGELQTDYQALARG
jgi:RNA polymerase sigma-70 factor (ECF subfamily)